MCPHSLPPPSPVCGAVAQGKIFLTTSGSGANTQSLRVLDSTVQLEQSVSLPAAGPLASYAKSTDLYPGELLHDYSKHPGQPACLPACLRALTACHAVVP